MMPYVEASSVLHSYGRYGLMNIKNLLRTRKEGLRSGQAGIQRLAVLLQEGDCIFIIRSASE